MQYLKFSTWNQSSNQTGEDAAQREEDRDRDEIQHRDPLVIFGQQPRFQAVAVV